MKYETIITVAHTRLLIIIVLLKNCVIFLVFSILLPFNDTYFMCLYSFSDGLLKNMTRKYNYFLCMGFLRESNTFYKQKNST